MSEIYNNKLIVRDAETNAIIPVMQAYLEGMENKKTNGNKLIIRDPETNAIIPVIKVLGVETGPGSSVDESQIRQIVRDEVENSVVGTTDAVVKNTLGQSQTDVPSQRLLTDSIQNWNDEWQ